MSLAPLATPLPADPPWSDAQLVRLARVGWREAFAELFRRHRPAATGVARRRVHDRGDADDVVAEAFARVLEQLHRLRQPGRFRSFLLAVVRSVASDRRRADRWSVLGVEADRCATGDLCPTDSDVEAAVERHEARTTLCAAIAGLPARQRYVVCRFYWDDVPVAVLARELGVTVNATTQLLFRARATLAARTARQPQRSRR